MKYAQVLTILVAGSAITACNDIAGMSDRVEIAPVGDSVVRSFSDDYVSAKGTWRIDGEAVASKVNLTDIACFREEMSCRVASAEIVEFGSSRFLDVANDIFAVDAWADDRIAYSSTGGCRRAQTVIDVRQETVTTTVTNDMRLDTCSGETVLPRLTHPRVIRLLTTDQAAALDEG